jgi:hypothetical protein
MQECFKAARAAAGFCFGDLSTAAFVGYHVSESIASKSKGLANPTAFVCLEVFKGNPNGRPIHTNQSGWNHFASLEQSRADAASGGDRR